MSISPPKMEHCLNKSNFLTNRNNKIDINIPTNSTVEIERKTSPTTIFDLSHKNPKSAFTSASHPPSQHFEELIILFFKFSYFLGITPHYPRIHLEDNGVRRIRLESNILHTILVITVHVCTGLRFILRFYLLSYDLRKPLNYFKLARTTLSTSLCIFFVWSLWMRHSTLKLILMRLSNLNFFPNSTILKQKLAQFSVLLVGVTLLFTTSVNRAVNECNQRVDEFCEGSSLGQTLLCRDATTKSFVQILFVIFNYFGRTTRRLPRLELLVVGLTMWQVCKSFSNFLKERNSQSGNPYQPHEISKILFAYEELKEISNLICSLVGEMLISEIVEDIVYFSLEVQLRLRDTDWFSMFVTFETWLMAFLAYYVSACAADQIKEVSIWLARDDVLSKLSPGKVTTLHVQLAANPIGLKGGSLFTVTKSFLGNVVTVWLTYFIILLQFQIAL